MTLNCPKCHSKSARSNTGKRIVRHGFFRRKCDGGKLTRYLCACGKSFSAATFDPCHRQRKRHLNQTIAAHLASSCSQRRTALLLGINKNTVEKKFVFLSPFIYSSLKAWNLRFPKAKIIEFDDLETIEHTKLKPLSVATALEYKTRRILGSSVCQMPAKGLIAKRSRKKYGSRPDHREQGRNQLFADLQELVHQDVIIKSDQNPHYPATIKKFFPLAEHHTYKGKRAASGGQGELKKAKWDPMFSMNQTLAKMRADVNRLFRRTWCTTKKKDRLATHIALFSLYHNMRLEKEPFHITI